jgi:hypothetical protein
MNTELLQKRFQEMGARVKFGEIEVSRFNRNPQVPVSIDIRTDRKGEYFHINSVGDQDIDVVNIDKNDRHLLLLHRNEQITGAQGGRKILELSKFLCGHDETHWFVAAIPESARKVVDIPTAKQALKPTAVIEAEKKVGLTKHKKEAHLHSNDARRRQGEWFFIPTDREFKSIEILHNEPIRRGRGKPHMCEELVRFGGNTVMVSSRYPNGITVGEYDKLVKENPEIARHRWNRMSRDMKVFVRGRITHSDHKTIILRQWNEVIPNEETRARAMRNVAFLD